MIVHVMCDNHCSVKISLSGLSKISSIDAIQSIVGINLQ